LPWVALAVENGFHAVTFDYQGYDGSGGTANVATLYDDSRAVLDWVLSSDDPACQTIHLLGTSLGAGPALALALRRRDDVDSVALDGAFDLLDSVIYGQSIHRAPALLITAILHATFPWLYETGDRLGEIHIPALFVNGEVDEATPPDSSERLFDAVASANKTFVVFPDLDHLQPLFCSTEEYASLLITFWREPTASPNPIGVTSGETIITPMVGDICPE
jgi:pimeloyl-ACP methyl ester carboxylesterase